jgi:hypothetical protein
MEERSRLRQFWLRILLAFGIFWGIVPLITVLFITRGTNDSVLDVLAPIINSLTILPASILAFWHRRLACIWLSANAALLLPVAIFAMARTHQYDLGTVIGVLVPVLIAVCLDFMEIGRWPAALERTIDAGLAQGN